MASVKFLSAKGGVKGILDYVTNREKTIGRLITGVNCVAETTLHEFNAVKNQFGKKDGRSYYHIVQSFSPDDPLDFDTAHEIGLQFAEYFPGFQCVVATHMNTRHKHNHIILNSVNFLSGKKFHQSAAEMAQVKEFSNQLCRQHGLSVTEAKADRKRIPGWKKKLKRDIKYIMEMSYDKEEFMRQMGYLGYKVKWEDRLKYITYTTPDNMIIRDRKLFDDALLKENMELYFELGGRDYLQSRREYHSPQTTVDEAVAGLASIVDALVSGNNTRFHLETVHHSEDEIERILARGGKIDRTVTYAVTDEQDEEYQQYHGMTM